jgi:FtsH-binding integral membrane protein
MWLLISALVRGARRDWIDVSLMLLPLPVLALWLVGAERIGGLAAAPQAAGIHRWDAAMGWVCLLLGAASVLFIRVRSRKMKAGAVVAVGILCGTAVARSINGDTGLAGLLAVALAVAVVLLSPVLIGGEHGRPRRRRGGAGTHGRGA